MLVLDISFDFYMSLFLCHFFVEGEKEGHAYIASERVGHSLYRNGRDAGGIHKKSLLFLLFIFFLSWWVWEDKIVD